VRSLARPHRETRLYPALPSYYHEENPMIAAHATELTVVERWRIDELERAGYDIEAASTLALRLDIDLHRAVDLLHRGCSQELALQILL
jgi:hypothetical protein